MQAKMLTCLDKIRDNTNNIVMYTLQDELGQIIQYSPIMLKYYIRTGYVTVDNLTLTSDDRLINAANNKYNKQSSAVDNTNLSPVLINKNIIKSIDSNKKLSFKSVKSFNEIPDNIKQLTRKLNNDIAIIEDNSKVMLVSTHAIEFPEDSSELFKGTKFNEIDISNTITNKVKNLNDTFKECELLEYININKFNAASLQFMCNTFYGCKSLKTLDFTNFKTPNLKTLRYTFYGCNKLEKLDLSSFYTNQLVNFYGTFQYCFNLKELNLTNFNLPDNALIGELVHKCNYHLSVIGGSQKIRDSIRKELDDDNNADAMFDSGFSGLIHRFSRQ